VSGTDALPGKSNYLIGKDSSKWHTDVPQFARVRYSQVYPGVDLVYYGKQGELEYDFQVAPGADPKQVALQFAGTDNLRLDSNGDLLLAANGGEMRLHAPMVYQTVAGEKKAVDGKFLLLARQQVGFEIGAYDRSRELVIDPVLTYSTYLGGSGAEDGPVTIAVDNALSAYVAGSTTSADFPIQTASATVPSAFQLCLDDPAQPQPTDRTTCPAATNSDAFIAKLSPAGDSVIYATYLGGSGVDAATGIAIDSGLDAIITGNTTSADFPVASAFQSSQGPSASNHVFVSKVDPNGHSLLYSTYLRGSGSESAAGVAVDFRGKIYVTGTTNSSDFPVTPDAFQTTPRATQQVFLSKIDPATSANASLVYSTYFGGGDPASGTVTAGGIAVDKNNGVYITGYTNFQHTGGNPSLDFPILNASQSCLNASASPAPSPCPAGGTKFDAFVAKLNPTNPIGSHLIYSTYFGGADDDLGLGIAVDSGGTAYITGKTSSANLPQPASTVTTIPFQKCLGQAATCAGATGTDAFLAKLNFTTSSTTTPAETVVYTSYLGGSDVDEGDAITVDSNSAAYITGITNSGDFPVLHAPTNRGTFQGGGGDAFVTRIDTTATTQPASTNTHFSFFLGGGGKDNGTGIALDGSGGVYIAGSTQSGDFPTTAGVLQSARSGPSDAFVTKLGPVANLTMAVTTSPSPAITGVGGQVTFNFTITNLGDAVPGATVVVNMPDPNLASPVSISGTGCPATPTQTTTCTLGPINTTGTSSTSPQITVVVAAKSHEPPSPTSFNVSAIMIAPQSISKSASATANDYLLALTPNSATVKAGSAATYNAQVSPTGTPFPGSVSISCSGLPTGASCSVANGSITNLNTGPQSRAVVVNTTVRTTTTTELRKHGLVYAVWFPVSGLAFLGLGVGGTMSRKRRAALGLLIGTFFVLVFLQVGCGSKSSGTTTTTGTPAGTYTFTVTASSGTGASHSQVAQLTVQ
jgi:hypothetical protein